MVSILCLAISLIFQLGNEPLRTIFHVKGTLYDASLMDPIFGRGDLYLETPNHQVRSVNGFDDLRGYVRIRSGRAALNYVRLRGSPALVYAFREYGFEAEIVDQSAVDSYYVFGSKKLLNELGQFRHGYFGFGSKKMLQEGRVKPAKVTFWHGKYIVVRTLLHFVDFGVLQHVTVRETVGQNGSYSSKVLGIRNHRPGWFDYGA